MSKKSVNTQIDKTAKIGKGTKIGSYCVIMEKVKIGPNSRLGNGVIVYPGVKIGKNAWLEDYVVVGRQPKGTKHTALKIKTTPPAIIGNNVVLSTQCVIYAGSKIGNDVYLADRVLIREKSKIENLVRMGKGVIVEHDARLGEGVIIQSYSIIAEFMKVEKGVFIGTFLCSQADKYMKMHSDRFNPPLIKKYARVGGNVTLLPGVIVGKSSFIGSGAVVTKDVTPNTVVVGNPARYLKDVDF